MECHIRPATPNDGAAVIELMHSSGPELYDYLYKHDNKTAQDFIAYQFIRDGGFSSHQWCYVAEANQSIVGVVECYDIQTYKKMLLPQLKDALSFYHLTAWPRLLKRLNQVNSVLSVPQPSQLYLGNLGVHPTAQSQGVGTQLIQFLSTRAKQKNYNSLALDVAVTNPHAQRLYERLGFRFVKDNFFKGDKPNNVPDARLLVKVI